MNNPKLRGLMTTLVAVLLLVYVGYQVYNAHHTGVQTETASYDTAAETVQVTGTAIRNETVLTGSPSGVLDYAVGSGDKVAKDGVIAKVYSTAAQVTAQQQLSQIDSEIAALQELQSPGSTHAANAGSIGSQITQQIQDIMKESLSGNYSGAFDSKDSLMYLLNERQIVLGKETDFSTQIAQLQSQRSALAQQAGSPSGTVASPSAGYFVKTTDGMENAVDYTKASTLTFSQVLALQQTQLSPVDGAVGKICTSYEWYFACTVTPDQAALFKKLGGGSDVSITFPFVSGTAVDATVAALNQDSPDSKAAVILKCDTMDSSLASIRNETAQIAVEKFTGIRVSLQAIHFQTVTGTATSSGGADSGFDSAPDKVTKEVEGVFVLEGNKIVFRQVIPEYSTDSYVICDPNPPDGELLTDKTVQLHDEVIVEGTNLYDGKVVG